MFRKPEMPLPLTRVPEGSRVNGWGQLTGRRLRYGLDFREARGDFCFELILQQRSLECVLQHCRRRSLLVLRDQVADRTLAAIEQVQDQQAVGLTAGRAVGGEAGERRELGMHVERIQHGGEFLGGERAHLEDSLRRRVGWDCRVVDKEADNICEIRPGGGTSGAERARGGVADRLILVFEQAGDLGDQRWVLPRVQLVKGVERSPAHLCVLIFQQRAERVAELFPGRRHR